MQIVINLNSEAKVLLNENGIARTQGFLDELRNNPDRTNSTKDIVTELWKSRIDEERYLTAPLNEIMGKYKTNDFQSPIATITDIDTKEQCEFNLNCVVSVLLNDKGKKKYDSIKKSETEVWMPELFDNSYITAPLNYIMDHYDESHLKMQLATVDEKFYDEYATPLGKSR